MPRDDEIMLFCFFCDWISILNKNVYCCTASFSVNGFRPKIHDGIYKLLHDLRITKKLLS